MKRSLAFLLAMLMLLSVAAGCQQPSPASSSSSEAEVSAPVSSDTPAPEPIELEFWFEGAGPERTVVYEKIINDFNAMDNNITVEGSYLDITNGIDKLNVAWSGGSMPDLVTAMGSWMSSMFAQGMCLQVDDRFDSWEERSQFDDIHVISVRDMDPQGRLFAVPIASNLNGIWYRKDIFAEKDLQAPTTWDNFFTAVEALTGTDENGQAVYGHSLRGGSGNTKQFLNVIISYAGYDNYWSDDNKAQILRSPEAAEICQKFVELFQNAQTPDSALNDGFNEMIANFNAGVAHTIIHNLGSYENQRQAFTPDQYAFTHFPVAKNGKLTAMVETAKSVSIVSTTEYPDECWEFIKHHVSMQNVSDYNEAVGELPARIDSSAQGWMEKAPHMTELPAYAATEKLTVSIPTYIPDYNSIQNEYAVPAFQEMLVGKISPEDFLDGWAEKIETAYEEYLANAQ